MKRNMAIMMLVTLGAVCVVNTTGYCGSDPHDRVLDIAVSVRQYTVEQGYLSGDPHKMLDVEVPRQPKVERTLYISGDPHDTENADIILPVIRRSFVINSIISDPHAYEEKKD